MNRDHPLLALKPNMQTHRFALAQDEGLAKRQVFHNNGICWPAFNLECRGDANFDESCSRKNRSFLDPMVDQEREHRGAELGFPAWVWCAERSIEQGVCSTAKSIFARFERLTPVPLALPGIVRQVDQA
ncbi:MAG TPA: hypothetical protein VHS97_05830, partial [Isosphaeraceae bacterium]|nr:hypothetical protein [Isosphaeraceae bacterium]